MIVMGKEGKKKQKKRSSKDHLTKWQISRKYKRRNKTRQPQTHFNRDARQSSLGALYKRSILEINLLRLLGVQLPSFGPEVLFPPPETHIKYGLIDATGSQFSLLTETTEQKLKSGRTFNSMEALIKLHEGINGQRLPTQNIYTDGSYYERYQLSGYAVWWGKDHKNNACGPVPTKGPLSSAKAEEYAIFLCLLQIKADMLARPCCRSFEIWTDALWVKQDILRWYKRWNKPRCSVGWKTSPTSTTEHREILRVAAGLLWDLRSRGVSVTLSYIKGHSGVVGNEIADLMAKHGSKSGQFIGQQPAIIHYT